MKDYWTIRSKKYNSLNWVNNISSLEELKRFSQLEKKHTLLEVGCGTGVVALYLKDAVNSVYAIDKSIDMLKKFPEGSGIIRQELDISKDKLPHRFNRIIGRMVFHHITDLPKAFENCRDMLVEGGKLIVQEGGVVPAKKQGVLHWYSEMMALKEDRHNFTEEELVSYFKEAGFKNIRRKYIVDRDFSIANWLNNSGQSKAILRKIYKIHLDSPEEIKKHYNMRILENDILIDSSSFFIRGER